MQLVGLVHDTPFRVDEDEPLGVGVATVDHVVPFQWRANGAAPFDPTAMQLAAAEHDTARRCFDVSASPLVIVHTEPFHRSTSTRSVSPLPTAVQFVAVQQETASSDAFWLGGFGLGTIDHDVPFQRSVSVFTEPLAE